GAGGDTRAPRSRRIGDQDASAEVARNENRPDPGGDVFATVRVSQTGCSIPYFASSRSALRYRAAVRSYAAIARSNVGSYGASRMPSAVSIANTSSPGRTWSRSAMSLGRVAATEPSTWRSLIFLTMHSSVPNAPAV